MKFYTGKYKIIGTICSHLSLAWIVALTIIVQITTNNTGEIKFFILFVGLILLSLAWQLLSIPLKWICIDRNHFVCHTLFKTTTIDLTKVGIIHYRLFPPRGKRSATMVLIFHDKHALTEIDCGFIDMENFLKLIQQFQAKPGALSEDITHLQKGKRAQYVYANKIIDLLAPLLATILTVVTLFFLL